MKRSLVRLLCGCWLASSLAVPSLLIAQQWRDATVRSCPRADSLLGQNFAHGKIQWLRPQNTDTFLIEAANKNASGSIWRPGPGPVAEPTPFLIFAVRGFAGRALLAHPPAEQSIRLTINDSGVSLRHAAVGKYEGPDQLAQAPVTLDFSPEVALLLGNARHATVQVGPTRVGLNARDLVPFKLVLRFAMCDSVPRLH